MPALLSCSAIPAPRSHRVAVALQILETHFGDIVRDVAAVMLDIDNCTLPILMRSLAAVLSGADKLTPRQVRQALLVLWKHNCLIVETETDLDPALLLDLDAKLRLSGLLYRLDIDMVLSRIRLSKVREIVRQRYGSLGEVIFESIALHGRLRFDTILREVRRVVKEQEALVDLEHQQQEQEQQDDSEDQLPNYSRPNPWRDVDTEESSVRAIFEQLVQQRFLVLVSPLDAKRRLLGAEPDKKATRMASLFGDAIKSNGSAASNAAAAAGNTGALTKASAAKRARAALESMQTKSSDETDEQGESSLPIEMRLLAAAASAVSSSSSGVTTVQVVGDATVVRRGTRLDSDDEFDASQPSKRSKADESVSGRGRGGRLAGRGRGGRAASAAAAAAAAAQGSLLVAGAGSDNVALQSTGGNLLRPDAYWSVGLEQPIREERHKAVREIVADQLEGLAGTVVKVMLAQSMSVELGSSPARSNPIAMNDLFARIKEELQRENSGTKIDLQILKKLLDVMRLSSLSVVQKLVGTDGDAAGPQFVVNYEAIVAALRRRTIQLIAQRRFGTVSGRIVELLQRNKFLEQQTVGERAILPARETRERLYKLFSDGWVNYAELSKRGDFNPSTNQYFWYLDMPRLKFSLLDSLYHALHNLLLRKQSEIFQSRELFEIASLNAQDQLKRQELDQRLQLLESCVRELDSTILLMESF